MNLGSLCAGIGGLDLAVEHAFGAEIVWQSEVDKDARTVLDARFGVPNVGDLTTVDWSTVESVDVLCAGYPCQPFSHAGLRKGEDDERNLWPGVWRAIRDLRPGCVVLENVSAHLSLGFGRVLGDLAEIGYDAEWTCVRASDVGAPHRRERVFIMASDTDSVAWSSSVPFDRRLGTLAQPSPLERVVGSDRGAPPDPDEQRREERGLPEGQDRNDVPDSAGSGRFGPYQTAVERWERLTRPAPDPLTDGRLSSRFVEWMMGFPDGWCSKLVSRNAALRLLGNAVVPAQGTYALSLLGSALRSESVA